MHGAERINLVRNIISLKSDKMYTRPIPKLQIPFSSIFLLMQIEIIQHPIKISTLRPIEHRLLESWLWIFPLNSQKNTLLTQHLPLLLFPKRIIIVAIPIDIIRIHFIEILSGINRKETTTCRHWVKLTWHRPVLLDFRVDKWMTQ